MPSILLGTNKLHFIADQREVEWRYCSDLFNLMFSETNGGYIKLFINILSNALSIQNVQ